MPTKSTSHKSGACQTRLRKTQVMMQSRSFSSMVYSGRVATTGPSVSMVDLLIYDLLWEVCSFFTKSAGTRPEATGLRTRLPQSWRFLTPSGAQLRCPSLKISSFLCSTSKCEDTTLIGHSMGAKIAMAVALRQRHRIANVIPVDNAPVDAALKSDFTKYTHAMRRIEDVGVAQTKRGR